MEKYESRSELIVYKDQEEFISKFNKLNVAWDMPVISKDDCPDQTTTKYAQRVYYYVRI